MVVQDGEYVIIPVVNFEALHEEDTDVMEKRYGARRVTIHHIGPALPPFDFCVDEV